MRPEKPSTITISTARTHQGDKGPSSSDSGSAASVMGVSLLRASAQLLASVHADQPGVCAPGNRPNRAGERTVASMGARKTKTADFVESGRIVPPNGWSNACLSGACPQDGAGTAHGGKAMAGWKPGDTLQHAVASQAERFIGSLDAVELETVGDQCREVAATRRDGRHRPARALFSAGTQGWSRLVAITPWTSWDCDQSSTMAATCCSGR